MERAYRKNGVVRGVYSGSTPCLPIVNKGIFKGKN